MFTVQIKFGTDPEIPAQKFSFETERAREAFMNGVDEASGWMDYELVKVATTEFCHECGHSVAEGSGRYVNRVPSSKSPEHPFHEGEWLCDICISGWDQERKAQQMDWLFEELDGEEWSGETWNKVTLAFQEAGYREFRSPDEVDD